MASKSISSLRLHAYPYSTEFVFAKGERPRFAPSAAIYVFFFVFIFLETALQQCFRDASTLAKHIYEESISNFFLVSKPV